jgi:hypothetical protein
VTRSLHLSVPSHDDGETLYTVTVDRPSGPSVIGLIVEGDRFKVIHWPDGENAETAIDRLLPERNDGPVEAAYQRALAALPERVELVYVAYDDSLTDKQIQHAFDGKAPFEDAEYEEWESDLRYANAVVVIEEHVNADDLALLRESAGDIGLALFDELRFAVEERDTSTPFEDLARQTGHKWMRYSVGVESSSDWTSDDEQIAADVAAIAEALGIDPVEHRALLDELVREGGTGVVHVLWYGAVDELIEPCSHFGADGQPPERRITWENPHLLILDSLNGAGHMVDFPGTVTLPFKPGRLKLDASGIGNGYSWSDEIAGLSSDRDTTTVTVTEHR